MFRDEQPTTTVDPEEVLRLAKQTEKPARTADGSGGLVPEEDIEVEQDEDEGDNWCAPTRTMDPLQQQELAARSTSTGQHDILEIPQAPIGSNVVPVPVPVPVPVFAPPKVVPAPPPYVRGATYALLALLVVLAVVAIVAHHFRIIAG